MDLKLQQRLNKRHNYVRSYGRNEDYIHNLKIVNGFEAYGDYNNEEKPVDCEGRDCYGRKVDLYGDYLFHTGRPKKKQHYCDFCREKIDMNFNRFDIFLKNNDLSMSNHFDEISSSPQFEYGADVNPCWSNNIPQFSRSSVGGSKYLLSTHPYTLDPDDLVFESRFESGNLARVVKVTQNYYELYLRPDMYTNRHTQWFYFRVKNTKAKTLYR